MLLINKINSKTMYVCTLVSEILRSIKHYQEISLYKRKILAIIQDKKNYRSFLSNIKKFTNYMAKKEQIFMI